MKLTFGQVNIQFHQTPIFFCSNIYIYIYIKSFSRRFYPKRLTNEDIIEVIKTNKRATTCYYKSWLA